jgi:hypothetical protein
LCLPGLVSSLPCVIATEVGIYLVRSSPRLSWTGIPRAPQTDATGHLSPPSTHFGGLYIRGPAPTRKGEMEDGAFPIDASRPAWPHACVDRSHSDTRKGPPWSSGRYALPPSPCHRIKAQAGHHRLSVNIKTGVVHLGCGKKERWLPAGQSKRRRRPKKRSWPSSPSS